MTVSDLLASGVLGPADVVAGRDGLQRSVAWVHVVDVPDVLRWVRSGHFVLTSGHAWPKSPHDLERMVRSYAETGVAGLGLAVPNYVRRFPSCMRDAANTERLPLIEIPWTTRFAEVSEWVQHTLLADQYALVDKADRIHRTLRRAAARLRDYDELAGVLHELVGRSVVIVGADGEILGRREDDDGGDSASALAAVASALPHACESRLGRVALGDAFRPDSTRDSPDVVACPIVIGSDVSGWVIADERDAPMSDMDLQAIEHVASIAAMHGLRDRELALLTDRLGFAFLDGLLEGDAESSRHVARQGRHFGFDERVAYRVAIATLAVEASLDPSVIAERDRLARELARVFELLGFRSPMSVRANRVVVLAPATMDVERFWKQFTMKREASFVVGGSGTGLAGVRESYRQARAMAANVATGVLRDFERELVPRVLHGDPTAHRRLVDEVYGVLEDQRGGDALVATLRTLVDAEFGVAETARQLGIHVNTVRYRIERIRTLAGLDTRESGARSRIRIATLLLEDSDNLHGAGS